MEKINSYPIGVKRLRKDNLPAKNDKNKRFRIGDKVWLKPLNAKCQYQVTASYNNSRCVESNRGGERHSESCETH